MTHLVRRLAAAGPTLILAALLLHPLARAQTAPAPAAPADVGSTEPGISERVKKAAAGPLYWIRLNAQKADTSPAKPAPRIAEIRPARPATGNSTSSAGAAPASARPAMNSAAAATAELPTPGPLGAPPPSAAMPGAVAAGMVAPAASSAAGAAHAATTPPAAEEPEEHLALLKAAEPEFPAHAVRRLRKGTVQVRFEVQPDGNVSNVTVVETTHRSLNDAALEAVSSWQFKPVPSPRSAVVDLGFDLDG